MTNGFKDFLRQRYGSQREFCECSGFKVTTVSSWVNGAAVPSEGQYKSLARYLGVNEAAVRAIFGEGESCPNQ